MRVVGGDAERGVDGADPAVGLVREPGRALGVVQVLVRQQYDGHVAGRIQDRA